MRTWATGLVALAAVAAQAPALLSPTAFRDRLAASVRALTSRPTVPIGPQSFRMTAADGSALTINSDNGYAQYLADPAQLDAIVARYARLLTGNNDDADIEQLVVIVRPSDYLTQSMTGAAASANFYRVIP